MPAQKKTYQHRDNKPFKPQRWWKRLVNAIEKYNKIFTLRLLGKILRVKSVVSPVPLSNVSSVLFIRYDALGDMIVTTPLWRILKRLKPSITIGVAGSFKNLDIVRADRDIDTFYDYSANSLRDFFRLSKQTRLQQWDVVFSCSFNQKTRNAIISRLASPRGITATVGTPNSEGHQALFSRLVPLPETRLPTPMTMQLQHLLRETISIPPMKYERPSIIVDAETERTTAVRIASLLSDDKHSKYVVINTDAQPFNKWGDANSIALARHLSQRFQEYSIMLTSLPSSQQNIERELMLAENNGIHYFATNDVHELTTLVRHSTLVISPDTSVAHIASAENKPLVGLYFTVGEWAPYLIPAIYILPKRGEPMASIPFDIVSKAAVSFIQEINNGTNKSEIVIIHSDDLSVIETRPLEC